MPDIDPVIERIRATIKKAPLGVELNPNLTEGRKLEALLIEIYTIAKNNGGGGGGFGAFSIGTYSGTANKFTLDSSPETIPGVLLQTTDGSVFEENAFFRPSEFDFVSGTSEINLTRGGFQAKAGHYLVVFQGGDGGSNPVTPTTTQPWQDLAVGTPWDLDAWEKVKTPVLTGNITINAIKGINGQRRELLVRQGSGNHTVNFNYMSSNQPLKISLEAGAITLLEGHHLGTNFFWFPKGEGEAAI